MNKEPNNISIKSKLNKYIKKLQNGGYSEDDLNNMLFNKTIIINIDEFKLDEKDSLINFINKKNDIINKKNDVINKKNDDVINKENDDINKENNDINKKNDVINGVSLFINEINEDNIKKLDIFNDIKNIKLIEIAINDTMELIKDNKDRTDLINRFNEKYNEKINTLISNNASQLESFNISNLNNNKILVNILNKLVGKSIINFSLSYNNIDCKNINLLNFTNLERLKLSTISCINDNIDIIIELIKKNPKLKYLNLANNEISDESCTKIFKLLETHNLQELKLSGNNITEKFKLTKNNLIKLDLSSNKIKNIGNIIDYFNKSKENNKIKEILLDNNLEELNVFNINEYIDICKYFKDKKIKHDLIDYIPTLEDTFFNNVLKIIYDYDDKIKILENLKNQL